MPEPTVYDAADKFRVDILKRERAAAIRLVNAYGRTYATLLPQIDALATELATNPDMKLWKKLKLKRLEQLKDQIEQEVGKFSAYLGVELDAGAQAAIEAASIHSRQAVQAALPGIAEIDAQIMGTWNRLPVEAVETLLGFLRPESPLKKSLDIMGPEVANIVQDRMTEAIALGLNPKTAAKSIAPLMKDAFRESMGKALSWALRTARTTQLYSYREASRANYTANAHIVKGWRWLSAKSKETCLACLSMDGKEFQLDVPLNDHQNGRCTMVPITVTYRDLGLDVDEAPQTRETARQWFEKQDEATQQAMMGKQKWEAWKAQKFEFDALAKESPDAVWGKIRVETPLKELLGAKAEPTTLSDTSKITAWADEYEIQQWELSGGAWTKPVRLSEAVSMPPDEPVRAATDAENRAFLRHVDALPNELKRLNKRTGAMTLRMYDDKVVDPDSRAYPAKSESGPVTLHPEHFTDRYTTAGHHSVPQHEFLHELVDQWDVGDWPDELDESLEFFHTRNVDKGYRGNEDITMMLTWYNKDHSQWAKQLKDVHLMTHRGILDEEKALVKVNKLVTYFKRRIGEDI
jgi:hypothetical protein